MARHGTMLPTMSERSSHGSVAGSSPDPTDPQPLLRTTMPSPIGDLILVASPTGLRALLWPGEEESTAGAIDIDDPLPDSDTGRSAAQPVDPDALKILDDTVGQLTEYFDGDRQDFDLPLDPVGTEFQMAVWRVLRDIPYGHTITYGEQAAALGDANKARAVGSANGRNPISIIVPCHRVIGADGSLTGYGGGIGIKQWLLDHERSSTSPQLPFG